MARKGTFTETFMFKDKRYYVYGKTKKEAHDKAVLKRYELEHGIKNEPSSGMTVASWARQWLADYKRGTVIEPWYRTLSGIVENYIAPDHIGSMKLEDVKPQHITRFYNSHLDLSESFGAAMVQVTRQIFDTAEANGYIEKSPARHIKMPRFSEKTGHRTITDAERDLTIRTADRYPDIGLFYLIMLFCGLRPQEVCALKRKDIDLDAKELHVTSAKKSDDTVGKTKTKAGARTVPIPDALLKRLDIEHLDPNEYVCRPARADRHTKTTVRNQWKRFKRLMDIENGAKTHHRHVIETTIAEDLTPYCYRHTYCTDLQDAGIPVNVAKELMGHSSIRVTADIYTHHSKVSYEDAREKINKGRQAAYL